jgi:hypothetical protein
MLNLIEAKNRRVNKKLAHKNTSGRHPVNTRKKKNPATPKIAKFDLIQIMQPNKIKYISGQQQLIKLTPQFTQFRVNPELQKPEIRQNEK